MFEEHQVVQTKECIGGTQTTGTQQPRHLCVDKNGSHFNAVYPSRCVECGRIF
jgi:hypothetical protein